MIAVHFLSFVLGILSGLQNAPAAPVSDDLVLTVSPTEVASALADAVRTNPEMTDIVTSAFADLTREFDVERKRRAESGETVDGSTVARWMKDRVNFEER